MRLIDADILFEKVGEIKPQSKEQYKLIREIMNMITYSYTEYKPQKTGKWIDSGYGVECSLCGEWYPHASIARNQLNFCPNCGADMREGDSE